MASSVLEHHAASPQNMGVLEDADAVGQEGTPGEGPYMIVYLKGSSREIEEATFTTYGCHIARACGSWMTEWLKGRTAAQAGEITQNDLVLILGGLPLGKEHCAGLAVNALKKALKRMKDEG